MKRISIIHRYVSLLIIGFTLFLQHSIAQDRKAEIKALIQKNAGKIKVRTAEIDDAAITDHHKDIASGITYVYIQQRIQEIPIYNKIITAAFRDNAAIYSSGSFAELKELPDPSPSLHALDAITAASKYLKLPYDSPMSIKEDRFASEKKYIVSAPLLSRSPIDAALVWVLSDDGKNIRLAWNINIEMLNAIDWWNIRIDARTGEYIEKDNWTVEETVCAEGTYKDAHVFTEPFQVNGDMTAPTITTASYNVYQYPLESPMHGGISFVTDPWLPAGPLNNATTLGWHSTDIANYNITRGNNVFAYLDITANNTPNAATNWPDTSTTPIPALTFNNTPYPTIQPGSNANNSANKKVALDNLFYWNNIIHDIIYQYGFTEAAGNFQDNNLERGGMGNDHVNAQAQDGAGLNNANFLTPADGTSGRMRMYLFSRPGSLNVLSPANIAGPFLYVESNFSTNNKLVNVGPVTGQVVYYNDNAAGTSHLACVPPANSIAGKIALIDRVNCTGGFPPKAKNAQNAGAIAIIVVNNVATAPIVMTGVDNTIIIPAIMISQADGAAFVAELGNNLTVTLASGLYLDGDLDNGIIVHEYGHGISNRLTGGPANASCLNNAEQGGEGWSDFFALMLTTNWATAALTDGALPRTLAEYALGTGIRNYPYSTNMAINPLTYANMALNTQVHAIGEIWCATLWDMTWNIIQQTGLINSNLYNSTAPGGNSIALNLVMTGLKLQTCQPGYLDARNAILAADSILYNNEHRCAIFSAFAGRGMGFSALQGSSTSATDQTAAFDLPASVTLTRINPQVVLSGAQITINRTALAGCQAVNGFVLRDTIPAGFGFVSANPAGVLNSNVFSFSPQNFIGNEVKNYSITLQALTPGCTLDSVINDNRELNTTGGFVASGSAPWAVSSTRSVSGSSSWRAPGSTAVSSGFLTSSPTAALPEQNLSVLSFMHFYYMEFGFDAGILEYSTNGSTWLDAYPYYVTNRPVKLLSGSGTGLDGKRAFTGFTSDGFIESILDLSSFGTTPVSFRYRAETDNGGLMEGWYVDNIVRVNGCGAILRTGMYNNADIRVDSARVTLFVKPAAVVPLKLLSFTAIRSGKSAIIEWKTANEVNCKEYIVEYSSNGSVWAEIGMRTAQNRINNIYTFEHKSITTGNNFYRLKMIDNDQRFSFSDIRLVRMEDEVVLFPNPADAFTKLYFNVNTVSVVNLVDAAGRQISSLPVPRGSKEMLVDTSPLASGFYYLKIKLISGEHSVKLIVSH